MANLYAEATIVSKKKQIKTIECYEPIHEHNSYFNVMGHVAPQAPPGLPPRTPSPGLHSPVDDRAPAGRINGYPTFNQATETGTCDRVPGYWPQ